ncbi:ferritin family protein [Flavobacterium sp.]|jgi:rubrerythrin|uniref:ferritin family protein n=1 Tax=Flavobacterium sp. TaxID=239 RepID=UPI0037BF91F6
MNTQEWLNKVLTDPEYKIHWLKRQFIGEVTAADRIYKLASACPIPKFKKVLLKIASDELQHSLWVLDLLENRDIPIPQIESPEDRYWKVILDDADSFDKTAAAGYHAEHMRLVRIRALADCTKIDDDIRYVFKKILPDEEFHEKAFALMASNKAIQEMAKNHEAGLELLGLEI